MDAEIKITVERQKRLAEMSVKKNLTDAEKAELLADIHEWFHMVWKKLPEFSKKTHRYQLDALENIILSLGGKLRTEPEPEPEPEAKTDEDDE